MDAAYHLRKAGSRKFDYKTGVNRGRSIIKVDYATTSHEKGGWLLWEYVAAYHFAEERSIQWWQLLQPWRWLSFYSSFARAFQTKLRGVRVQRRSLVFCKSIRFYLSAVPIVSLNLHFPIRYTLYWFRISCNKNKILNESKKIDRFNLVCVFYVQCLFVIRSSFSSRHGSHPHHLLGRRETPLETSEANNFVPIKITISLSVRLGS